MKIRHWSISLSAIIAMGGIPLLTGAPVLANLGQADVLVAQATRAEVKLQLTAAKKIVTVDKTGKEKISWEGLDNGASVIPGDIIRYTVSSKNTGTGAAKNLVITQPIPDQMVYRLNSTTKMNGVMNLYSIDGGRTFVPNPTIKVKLESGKEEQRPAPAEMYTHVQWKFNKEVSPQASISVFFETQVKK